MFKECLENLRKQSPLIHCMTNYVTVNDVANALLAIGGSPIMSDDEAEVEEITSICNGLDLNIGTLNQRTIASMLKAGKKASSLHHPILLDPVGAGASKLRTKTAVSILESVDVKVIRGNVSELKALALGSTTTKGVDASSLDAITDDNLEKMITIFKDYAQKTKAIIAVTGAIDLVSDGKRCFVIRNGVKEMSRITGTGCMLSGMLPAFICANPDHLLEACASGVIAMGLAGEMGKSYLASYEGNASLRTRIIDALMVMTPEELEEGAKYELY